MTPEVDPVKVFWLGCLANRLGYLISWIIAALIFYAATKAAEKTKDDAEAENILPILGAMIAVSGIAVVLITPILLYMPYWFGLIWPAEMMQYLGGK